jgi:hypothetical protein
VVDNKIPSVSGRHITKQNFSSTKEGVFSTPEANLGRVNMAVVLHSFDKKPSTHKLWVTHQPIIIKTHPSNTLHVHDLGILRSALEVVEIHQCKRRTLTLKRKVHA